MEPVSLALNACVTNTKREREKERRERGRELPIGGKRERGERERFQLESRVHGNKSSNRAKLRELFLTIQFSVNVIYYITKRG